LEDTLVLGYHAVSPDWPAMLSVARETLEEQVDSILARGYRPVTFTEAVRSPGRGRRVAFTFDDGFRSVVDAALPILESRGAVATAFVPTRFLDKSLLVWPGIDRWLGGPHEHELRPLTWDDARNLIDRGWEIGSHTCSHPHLTEVDESVLLAELTDSRRACSEQLGVPCWSVAYPYGSVNKQVIAATAAAGYRTAAGLPVRLHRRHPLNWPRIGVFRNDPFWRFQAKVGRVRRRLIGWDVGEALLRAQARRNG
jgi:peptidoglycan/xylan/chitin deacetylase (PgdA/CDA1 family)